MLRCVSVFAALLAGAYLLIAALAEADAQDVSSPAAVQQADLDQAPASLGDGWATARPSEAGLQAGALGRMAAAVEAGEIHNVHAVLIEHAGRLVYERYFEGSDERWGDPIGKVVFDHKSLHDLRSVSKSVTTALLGIALGGDHREALDRPIASYFEGLRGALGEGVETVTLEHVLTMTAGLEWNEMTVPYTSSDNDEIRLYYTDDPIAMVLARPRHRAGRVQVVLQWRTDPRWWPVSSSRWRASRCMSSPRRPCSGPWASRITSGSVHLVGRTAPPPSAASGLRMRARDLAKIGSLYLHKGKWNGRQDHTRELG